MKTNAKAAKGLIFLIPGLLGFTLFFIAPFCVSVFLSFLDKPIGGSFAGLNNFISLFNNKSYMRGFFNTVKFISVSTAFNLTLALTAALLLNKLRPKDARLISLFFLIPLVIPSGSLVFFWKSLFSYDGALNGLLYYAGIEKINWLDSNLAFWAMTLIFVWKNLGYSLILFTGGLAGIPKELYEAASLENAKASSVLFYITLPCLFPTLITALLMSIINSFKIFREIYLITGSYPHSSIYTLQHFMNNMFVSLKLPSLTAATTIIVILIAFMAGSLLSLERRVSA